MGLFSAPSGRCCTTRVLLWDTNCNIQIIGLTELQTVYQSNGIGTHLSGQYSGNLNDYSLIVWLMAESNPVWLPSLATWVGRLHVSGEWGPAFATSNTYVNTLGHGITLANDLVANAACNAAVATVAALDITAGVANIRHAAASSLSGGTTVATTGGQVWMARNKVGNIDWVVAGDSNHCSDFCTGSAALNSQFLLNLYNVAV